MYKPNLPWRSAWRIARRYNQCMILRMMNTAMTNTMAMMKKTQNLRRRALVWYMRASSMFLLPVSARSLAATMFESMRSRFSCCTSTRRAMSWNSSARSRTPSSSSSISSRCSLISCTACARCSFRCTASSNLSVDERSRFVSMFATRACRSTRCRSVSRKCSDTCPNSIMASWNFFVFVLSCVRLNWVFVVPAFGSASKAATFVSSLSSHFFSFSAAFRVFDMIASSCADTCAWWDRSRLERSSSARMAAVFRSIRSIPRWNPFARLVSDPCTDASDGVCGWKFPAP